MVVVRTALSNPRAFVVGLALGALLMSAGFILALFATGQVGATHDDDSVVHACVSRYTGTMRHVTDPANCTPYETAIDLGAGDPAENLTYTVRTVTTDIAADSSGQHLNVVSCLDGETAISGGSRVILNGEYNIVSWIDISKGGGPVGSPPTGWSDGFHFSSASSDTTVETWVICVS